MGDAINHFFESQLQWVYDNGVVCFTGRDVVAFIMGFLMCLILWALFDGKEIGKK